MAQGLLDWLKQPEAQGLLGAVAGYAANAQRGAPINSLGRGGLAGLLAYGKAQDNEREIAQTAKTNELRDMQIAAYRADVAAKNDALTKEAAKRAAIPNLFRPGGMSGGEAVPQTVGGVEMFSQPMGVSPVQATPGGFDVMGAIRAGFTPDEIQKYAGLQDAGRPKATRQVEVDDGKGGKKIVLADDFGREVAGFNGYVAPVQVNQGGQITFAKPQAGVSLPVSMSPSEQDASRRGWATVNQGAERLKLDQSNASAGKAPAGYRFKADSTLEAIPGGPADIKAGDAGAKAEQKRASMVAGAQSVLREIDDAKKLVGVTTAGVGGVMRNVPATDARDLSAKLETIKANLGFDRLQQMRDQSPTGGALGAVAVQELTALQSTVASLDQLQSPAQLNAALDKVRGHYNRWLEVVQQAGKSEGGATGSWGGPAKAPMKGQVVDGYKFKGGNPADQANWEKQ